MRCDIKILFSRAFPTKQDYQVNLGLALAFLFHDMTQSEATLTCLVCENGNISNAMNSGKSPEDEGGKRDDLLSHTFFQTTKKDSCQLSIFAEINVATVAY